MDYKPDSGTVVMEGERKLRPTSGPDTTRKPDSGPDIRFTVHLEHTCTAIMELRPNSGPDTPPGTLLEHQTPDSIITACVKTERANQYRMMVNWEGPRQPTFVPTLRDRARFRTSNGPT